MGSVIDFNSAKAAMEASNVGNTRKTDYSTNARGRIRETKSDTFEHRTKPSSEIEPKGYTLEEIVRLVGPERTDEIFSKLLEGAPNTKSSVVSPLIEEASLKENLRTVWDDSKEAQAERKAKLSNLAKTRRAFRQLEIEASRSHEEKYGKRADIRIKVTDYDNDEEKYLTDMLKEQEDFYRKGKMSASMEVVGKKMNQGFNRFLDLFLIQTEIS